ncbi:hypothetical protein [Pseudoalteromonas sp. G4]|uniref:hypothetical protein n=1 Tax=Pseudoalteromonas sp. G4 TaxID=2992761 RepID=UPI00237E6771|nr:hypothetical protein [Pseudoalteromonas sp. G4]MDE3272566.1 hypothetical protein [Pseudoalteromonas sp. G4]
MIKKGLLLTLPILLIGCGGSDKKTETPKPIEPVNQAPTVSIIDIGDVINLQTVEFIAAASDADNNLASTEFSLSSNGEVLVTSDTTNFTYQFPYSELDVDYQLSITATDSDGLSANSVQDFTVPASSISIKAYEPVVSLQHASFEVAYTNVDSSQVVSELILEQNGNLVAEASNSALAYAFPLFTESANYKLMLNAASLQGQNLVSLTNTISIDPIAVSFELPFDAITRRLVDVKANIENIDLIHATTSWQFTDETNYPLTAINKQRVRFFAEKYLTEEHDPADTSPMQKGQGINQDIDLTFKLNFTSLGVEQILEFPTSFTIKPIEQIVKWPLHDMPQSTAQAAMDYVKDISAVARDTDNVSALAENAPCEEYLSFDFNTDNQPDYLCGEQGNINYYQSVGDGFSLATLGQYDVLKFYGYKSSGKPNSALFDTDQDGLPELYTVINDKELVQFKYNGETQVFDKTLISQLEFIDPVRYVFAFGYYEYYYDFAHQGDRFAFAYGHITYSESDNSVLTFQEFNVADTFQPVKSIQLIEPSLLYTRRDLNINHIDYLYPDHAGNYQLTAVLNLDGQYDNVVSHRIAVINTDFTNVHLFPEAFSPFQTRIEDFDQDGKNELVAEYWEPYAYAYFPEIEASYGFTAKFELNNGQAEMTVLDSVMQTQLLLDHHPFNHDTVLLDNMSKVTEYEENFQEPWVDFWSQYIAFHTLENQETFIAQTNANLSEIYAFEDVDNDGDLDMVFGDEDKVYYWAENVNGYPIDYEIKLNKGQE